MPGATIESDQQGIISDRPSAKLCNAKARNNGEDMQGALSVPWLGSSEESDSAGERFASDSNQILTIARATEDPPSCSR